MLHDATLGVLDAKVERIHPLRATWGGLSADALAAKVFEPLCFAVPGILPEGLTILAGRPKFGKSYLALGVAIAVASGGYAIGSITCEQGDVLYCALEDGERRLHERLHRMLPGGQGMPTRLFFTTSAKRIGQGLEKDLRDWLADHPAARLVILDTWRCVKPADSGRSSAYDEDARGLNPLHEIAKDHPGVAFLLVHHVRKMEAEDVFDTISGTHGLTGVADTLMVLARHGEGAKLCAQGRDLESYEKALTRDTLTGGWIVQGDARELAKTGERQAILDVLAEAAGEPVTVAAIVTDTGKSTSNVVHLLKKLLAEGQVVKRGHGKYALHPLSTQSTRSTSRPRSDPELNELSKLNGVYDD